MKTGSLSIKRALSMILALVMILSMFPAVALAADTTKTIYMKPGPWTSDNAWFDAWVWGEGMDAAWYTFAAADDDGIYAVEVPTAATGMKILRKSPEHAANAWESWNDSGDQTISGNCFIVNDWGNYSWGTYTPPAKQYTVTFNGTNVTSDGAATVTEGEEYTATLSAAEGYTLPEKVTVTVSDKSEEYNLAGGVLTIPAASITGDITITAAGVEEETEPETITVYFRNNWLWTEVKVFFWGSDTAACADWPGDAMTFVKNDGTHDIYSAEIPADADGFKMSGIKNDGSGNRDETPDLAVSGADGMIYSMAWDNGNICNKEEYTSSEPETPTEPAAVDYYLVGYINGADHGCNADDQNMGDYRFVDGQLTATFTSDSYVFVKTTGNANWYMSEGYAAKSPATLYNVNVGLNDANKLFVPGGVEVTFTLTVNDNDTLTLSYETAELPAADYYVAGTAGLCGAEWDAGNAANKMTLNETTGLYEKTFEDVPIGKHSFKITNGTWDKNWGGEGADGNYETTLTAISDVTITFDPANGAISVAVVPTGAVPTPLGDVTIHFRNTGSWGTVKGYAWDLATGALFTDGWPGKTLEETADTDNWYTMTFEDLTAYSGLGVIFDDGNGNQTADIAIVEAGTYWYDGTLLSEKPATWPNGAVETVDYQVTLHLANTLNWGNANLYTWIQSGATPTGGWPGTAAGLDADGFYTLSFTYKAPAGQGLKFIFSGSGQTADLELAPGAFDAEHKTERWVVLKDKDQDDKYTAEILDNPDSIAVSPIVDGTSVTFQYKGGDSDTVVLWGTMNGWKESYAMTNNGHGVYSVTVDNVPYGIGQYKFQVNNAGEWITDPLNTWTVDGNSAFLVSNPNLDENEVNIVVHYTPASADWNLCAWGATGLDDQYDFVNNQTTITLDGRANQYVAFKIRKSVDGNDWAEQSGEMKVNLGDIVSGTIHVYVADDFSTRQELADDVVTANKITSVELDYDNNLITIHTSKMVNDALTAFDLVNIKNPDDTIAITSYTSSGSAYSLTLNKTLDLVNLWQYKIRFSEQVKFTDHNYTIGINTVYASDKFAAEFTYTGDLGAKWSADSTEFVLWAPTASAVSLNLYQSGTAGTADQIGDPIAMTKGEKGVWHVTVEGDLNGTYYTYSVTRDGTTVEAVDPYARTTGVNGKRGMVIDLASTDPTDGWSEISKPAKYTDAIIYELHVRDFSIDDSSGVKDEWQGKFLALTQEGTKTSGGSTTGLDYLKDLGITHLHLLPIYDYASVKEDKLDVAQFNWGYDPQNYNTPEGSYSTDPYNGEVRVQELKETVDTLHENNIGVIMDVVYNHVYDAGTFCFNQIVPGYFSRPNSNTSGCGNDTASEREMVRKYIVESVVYWAEEYHLDGFRFDLVGLLDVDTINQIVAAVHEIRPDIIFYGEGWDMDSTAREPGTEMAKQGNASKTPGFGYFSDGIRNALAGNNGNSLGFVSGNANETDNVAGNFLKPWWPGEPTQVIQYASCHDNYTLIDKMVVSSKKEGVNISAADLVKMNNLAASIYMMAPGVPFIHAGEEFLREKLDSDSHTDRCENSYNAPDEVNKIRWSNLDGSFYNSVSYADNVEYYKGLIEFRKTHAALHLDTSAKVAQNVTQWHKAPGVFAYQFTGGEATGDLSESIIVIFNANKSEAAITLPSGNWNVCIDGENAGAESLRIVSGTAKVAGISAMVLVQDTDGHMSHTEGAPTIEKETKATCTTDGKHETVVRCTVCEAELTRTSTVVAATGHTAGEAVTENKTGSCTTGITYDQVVSCVICTEELSRQTITEDPQAHTYTNGTCTVCGDVFTITASVTPEKDLSMTFTVDMTKLQGDGHYAAISHTLTDGSVTTVTIAQADWDNGSFTYAGIAAKQMTERISVTVCDSEGNAVSQIYNGSVRDCLMAQIAAEEAGANDELKLRLWVDTLNYGAAAQNYFKYNTKDLANADLTAEQKGYAGKTTIRSDKLSKGPGYSSASLSLENTLELNILFFGTVVDRSMHAVVTYTDSSGAERELIVEGKDFRNYSKGRLGVIVTGIAAADFDSLITCEVRDSEGNVRASGARSIANYLTSAIDAKLGDVFVMANRYGQSAAALAAANRAA